MRILLINTNPVVSRLISWNSRDNDLIQVDEVDGSEKVSREYYDVLFIDEKCCNDKAVGKHIQKVNAGEKILFSSHRENDIEGIDRVILKPFLPSEITETLQFILQSEEIKEKEEPLVLDENAEADAAGEEREHSILDEQEVEAIKQLLLDEGLEIEQDEVSESESQVSEKKNRPEVSVEENFLESLMEMKPKKIRKLLEGAEISITIRFPKEV